MLRAHRAEIAPATSRDTTLSRRMQGGKHAANHSIPGGGPTRTPEPESGEAPAGWAAGGAVGSDHHLSRLRQSVSYLASDPQSTST